MALLNSAETYPPVLQFRALAGIFLCFLLFFLIISTALPILFQSLAPKFPVIMLIAGSSADPRVVGAAVGRLFNPWLIFTITLIGLKVYLPGESYRLLFKRFGFDRRSSWVVLVGTFVGGLVLAQIFLSILMPHFGPADSLVESPTAKLNALPKWFVFIIGLNTFTLVPIAEEFLFRGVLYTGLASIWKKPAAMIVTSVGFMALHSVNIGYGNTITHLALVVVTLALVVTRERSGGLYVPVMLHAGFNFSAVAIH